MLEIGTAYGYSSRFFAHLLPESHITTVELSDTNYQVAVDNIWEQGLTNRIQVIHGDGSVVLDELIQFWSDYENCVNSFISGYRQSEVQR